MAKVITFSTLFPSYHPKKGNPTYFAKKIWRSTKIFKHISAKEFENYYRNSYPDNPFVSFIPTNDDEGMAKHHTIRAGKRFKEGEYFSPRIWSGKPYNSKQIIIAPEIKIQKVFDIEVCTYNINEKKSGISAFIINDKIITDWQNIAQNDGLSQQDLLDWFLPNAPFKGQIICWNKNIEY